MTDPHPDEPATTTPVPGTITLTPRAEPESRQWVLYVSILVAILVLGGGALAFILFQQDRINNLQTRVVQQNELVASLTDDLVASQENAQRLYDQLLSLPGVEPEGEDPEEVAPIPTPGATGATGQPGPRGAPGADSTVPGPQGSPGPAGPSGQDGQDGSDGATGATGATGESIVGPQGPQGEAGAPGSTGAQGPQGVGVVAVSCAVVDSGTAFRFTLSDGTTQDVPGACAPLAAVE